MEILFVRCFAAIINFLISAFDHFLNVGFTRSFYPFNGQQNYQKPLVAVRFDLVDKPYQIHCTLNATNVQISPAANKLSEAQVFVGVNQPQ